MSVSQSADPELRAKITQGRDQLDDHTYETVQWHFHPSTGCSFWLAKAKELRFGSA